MADTSNGSHEPHSTHGAGHVKEAADGKAHESLKTSKEQHQLRQQQICAHMNADHQDTLTFFLQVYCKVPRKEAQSAKLEEIRLTGMTITTSQSVPAKKTHYFVPFEPALSSISEVRQKSISMHHDCLKALGRSDITIKEYRPPTGFPAVLFTTCLFTFIAFSRRANFEPGSHLYSLVLRHVPGFAAFCYTIQPLLISLIVGIHLSEAIHMSFYRLKPHNIPFGSRLWFCWFVNDFIEGFTTLNRFDALVEEERAKKAQQGPNSKKAQNRAV